MRTLSLRLIAMFLAGAGSLSAQTAGALDATVTRDLDRLRAATRAFQSLDSAVAAGYPREVAACIVHEHHGAMGYHHVKRANVGATLDVTKPQILLYEKAPDGGYKLNGVEFFLPYQFWSRDSAPPTFLGRKLQREDNLNYWYLHVWAWTNNTDGIFADFNPSVQCPTEARKVYTPFVRPPA